MRPIERRLATLESSIAEHRGRPAEITRAQRTQEIWASSALAGATLTLAETRSLLERGIVSGTRPFRDYLLVWGYGQGLGWVARQRPSRPVFTVAELRALHVHVCAALALVEPAARDAGAWRLARLAAPAGAAVATPPAMIAREVASFADRFAAGPPPHESPFVWLAAMHERFDRLRPFALANGRVLRLLLGLALVRLGLPLAPILPRDARAYRRARIRADSGDAIPLAYLIARGVARNLEPGVPRSALVPLSALADERLSLAALRKAATRGQLRHVYVG
ncbi:MAG TPA: Fic family protein, partial [Candidatus Binatia bacterium]|nr:Fic family protein [Candidatus Binatia bacterium]